jgi:hypothetical protein
MGVRLARWDGIGHPPASPPWTNERLRPPDNYFQLLRATDSRDQDHHRQRFAQLEVWWEECLERGRRTAVWVKSEMEREDSIYQQIVRDRAYVASQTPSPTA